MSFRFSGACAAATASAPGSRSGRRRWSQRVLDRLVGRRIVVRDPAEVDPLPARLRDQLDAALDRRQHPEPQQIDLQEARVGAGVLVPLDDVAPLHRRRDDRTAIDQRPCGDDHPARVLDRCRGSPCACAASRASQAQRPRQRRAAAGRSRCPARPRARPSPRCRARPARSPPAAAPAPCRARGSHRAPGRSGRPRPAPRGPCRSARTRAGSAPRGCHAGSRGRCPAAPSGPRSGSGRSPARWRSDRHARARSDNRRSRTRWSRGRGPGGSVARGESDARPRTSNATSRASSSISWCSTKKPARLSFSMIRSSCSSRPAASP